MNNVKLVPSHLNSNMLCPIDSSAKATLMSFGFYDYTNLDYRTLEQWKVARERTGTEAYIKFFVPSWIVA